MCTVDLPTWSSGGLSLKDLRRWDLLITGEHMSTSLGKRKNDQFREDSSILVTHSNSSCPVVVMERSLLAGGHHKSDYLFRTISHTKHSFPLCPQPLTYSRGSELVRKRWKSSGLIPSSMGCTASVPVGLPQQQLPTGCSCAMVAGIQSLPRTCTSRKQKKPSLGFSRALWF